MATEARGELRSDVHSIYSAALAALSMGLRFSRTAIALIAGIVGYLVTIYFVFQPSFAKAFDNWMISLLLWMSPFAGVILADFFIRRKGRIDVAELYREAHAERVRGRQLGRHRGVPRRAGRGVVGRGRPRARPAGSRLDQAARRRRPELAGRHRRGGAVYLAWSRRTATVAVPRAVRGGR